MDVGYKLYREVRDFAPAGLTSGELVVAWVIADDANDSTRRSWISHAELCFRARLGPSAVRSALARLAARGYEFRVPHGPGKDGRTVFATKGHATDYLVPDFTKGASPVAASAVDNPAKGANAKAPNRSAKAPVYDSKAPAEALKGATARAPLSSDPLSIPSTTETTAVTPSVEGRAPVDNGRPKLSDDAARELARRQVAASRRNRVAQ